MACLVSVHSLRAPHSQLPMPLAHRAAWWPQEPCGRAPPSGCPCSLITLFIRARSLCASACLARGSPRGRRSLRAEQTAHLSLWFPGVSVRVQPGAGPPSHIGTYAAHTCTYIYTCMCTYTPTYRLSPGIRLTQLQELGKWPSGRGDHVRKGPLRHAEAVTHSQGTVLDPPHPFLSLSGKPLLSSKDSGLISSG